MNYFEKELKNAQNYQYFLYVLSYLFLIFLGNYIAGGQ